MKNLADYLNTLLNISILLIIWNLSGSQAQFFRRDGDIIIGLVLPVHEGNPTAAVPSYSLAQDTQNLPYYYNINGTICQGYLRSSHVFLVTQFRRVIDEINDDPNILGGFKLGYDIVDSCSLPSVASIQATRWMAAKIDAISHNFSMTPHLSPVAFVIGAITSTVTTQLAQMLQQVNIPVIDFGASSPTLSNRQRYPIFARTIPSDTFQATVIRSIMFQYLEWNCSHLIYSEGVYGETGSEAIRKEFDAAGICRASDIKVPVRRDTEAIRTMETVVESIAAKSPTTAVIVCFCARITIENLLAALRNFDAKQKGEGRLHPVRFALIASDAWGTSADLDNVRSVADGAITIQAGRQYLPDFGQYVSDNFQTIIKPENIDPWMDKYVSSEFMARDQNQRQNLRILPNAVPVDTYADLMTTAIYAGVFALKDHLQSVCPRGIGSLKERCGSEYVQITYDGKGIYSHIRNSPRHFSSVGRPSYSFMENLDGQAIYEVFYYRQKTDSYTNIGYWSLEDNGLGLYSDIDDSMIDLTRWPDTGVKIEGTCWRGRNDSTSLAIGSPFDVPSTANTCPKIFYYPNPDLITDKDILNVSCSYYCRANQVQTICSETTRTVPATTPQYVTTTPVEEDSDVAFTALAVVLAIVSCAFLVCIALLIFACIKNRKYKRQLKEANRETIKISAPSTIASNRTFAGYRNNTYSGVYGPSSSSVTYQKRRGGESSEIQLLPASLQDELYLVPQSNTTSQASHSGRIKRIISGLGGGEEYAQLTEQYFVPNNELIWGEAFADGKFAFVYNGTLKRQTPEDHSHNDYSNSGAIHELPVAVKVLKTQEPEDSLDMLKEAYLMASFSHPNVMPLQGISLLFDRCHLILPLMSNGNLRDFIRQYFSSLSDSRLVNFCLQISIGMEYLSSHKFIHRDLAARNVLVDSEGYVKIADFGMSRHLQQSDYYKPVTLDRPLPIRWHPPESLQMRTFGEKSDVWSFGVVCWEVFSGGMQPYGGLSNNEVVEHIAAGNRLPKPDRCPDEFFTTVMMKCWTTAQSERPTFSALRESIRSIQNSVINTEQAGIPSTTGTSV